MEGENFELSNYVLHVKSDHEVTTGFFLLYTPKVLLITGAAGFIGSNATLRILREYPAYKVPLSTDTKLHIHTTHFELQYFRSTLVFVPRMAVLF